MAALVHGEKEHFDWFPEWSVFCCIDFAKMDCSPSDFIDWRKVENLFLVVWHKILV